MSMINHLSIGVRDVARAKSFYDATLGALGYKCLSAGETSLGYGDGSVALWINEAKSPVKADPNSGLHLCFTAASRKAVDSFHKAALKAGGKDNGKPGLRTDYSPDYYGAFVIDPDGNNVEAVCHK